MSIFGHASKDKSTLPDPADALPGRAEAMPLPKAHFVLNQSLGLDENTAGLQVVVFGMGCFWGAEKKFWVLPGVATTAVGYAAGYTPNPTYEEVCSGKTGHNEVVRVVYDPSKIKFSELLKQFWENHNPTQGMRQGNDRGTQYRSGIYTTNKEQLEEANESRHIFQSALSQSGLKEEITTEILMLPNFYFAEGYHQQYLAKNPSGYCGLGGTGACYPANATATLPKTE